MSWRDTPRQHISRPTAHLGPPATATSAAPPRARLATSHTSATLHTWVRPHRGEVPLIGDGLWCYRQAGRVVWVRRAAGVAAGVVVWVAASVCTWLGTAHCKDHAVICILALPPRSLPPFLLPLPPPTPSPFPARASTLHSRCNIPHASPWPRYSPRDVRLDGLHDTLYLTYNYRDDIVLTFRAWQHRRRGKRRRRTEESVTPGSVLLLCRFRGGTK